ncbi:MAG: hypothetical protein JNM00_14545, partial [Flavobacteriales bacterium]|nr:hypothetical protein [Flavobacteriales bacterium]
PLQLLVLHIKHNHLLLLLWLLLFGFATGTMASGFGVPQQFLVPEYRGGTGPISFFIVGFALGGFIEAFNLYTYILYARKFPFIATLNKPFWKFTLNNSLLPLIFLFTYAFSSATFQINREFFGIGKVILHTISLFAGVAGFAVITYFYFSRTNKEARQFGRARKRKSKDEPLQMADSLLQSPIKWLRNRRRMKPWHVETYVSSLNRISLARESSHYSKQVLAQVLAQNHINASRFELALILSFLIIGSLREFEFFVIPAAASALLFFTMVIMLVSALFSWIRGWTITLFLAVLVVINFFYTDLQWITYESRAYGLNYETSPAPYHVNHNHLDTAMLESDRQHMLAILEQWKSRVHRDSTGELPKMVIINCSGGGSRSAFWTTRTLMLADSALDGRLMDQCVLITGASGGMIGASYARELWWRQQRGLIEAWHDTTLAEDMSQDLLNPIMLSIATNDWFIRYQKFSDHDHRYTKDRGYAFEKQLNRNTHGWFPLRMDAYREAENRAEIPMVLLSPTIQNDGRRMLISTQPISFLCNRFSMNGQTMSAEDIEFSRMFEAQGADSLQFLSALRMNATFPYVLPTTSLPSDPEIGLMDAGVRDNFGLKSTLQFLYTFREWIEANTSGVVIMQVRDLPKGREIERTHQTLLGQFMAPLGSIYGNMTKTHDYNSDQMLTYLDGCFEKRIDVLTFELQHDEKNFVSLSWHLTRSEKSVIRRSSRGEYFRQRLGTLDSLMRSR